MRWLYVQFFDKSPLLIFPLIGLVIFVTIFALVLMRTLGRHGRALQVYASMPLEPDQERRS
jgi:hypothetical protein